MSLAPFLYEPAVVAAHLYVVYLAVDARAGDQLLVRADVGDPAVLEHEDAVGLHQRGYAVRDEYHRRLCEALAQCGADLGVGLGVHGGERVVEDMMGVSHISIRAMATRCFWPPERVTPLSPTSVP